MIASKTIKITKLIKYEVTYIVVQCIFYLKNYHNHCKTVFVFHFWVEFLPSNNRNHTL